VGLAGERARLRLAFHGLYGGPEGECVLEKLINTPKTHIFAMKDVVVRFADKKDLSWLVRRDDLSRVILLGKITAKKMLVAQRQGRPVGFIRVEFLWSKVPYLSMIRVDKAHQRQGVGKSLLQFLQKSLKKKRHKILLTSSQANENVPQKWHRKMGFKRCGYIDNLQKEGRETFFYKKL
jgi:ribosomal protein S18 acetylase RimI-like enzyme